MAYTIEVESDLVLVVMTGELTMEIAKESREDAGRVMHERGLKKVLVDVDQTHFAPATPDLFDFNTSYYDAFPPASRIAVVIDARPEFKKDTEFAETVAQNRGIMMKLFADRESAYDWLRGEI